MNPMNSMTPLNQMNPINPAPFTSTATPPWFPALPPLPPFSSTFWDTTNVNYRLRGLQNTIELAKAMQKELEMLIVMKDGETELNYNINRDFSKFLGNNKVNLASQESVSLEAANALISKLGFELQPFKVITDDTAPWEEKSAAVRLANKMQKSKRNKRWRKRKRKFVAESIAEERARFDQADQEADEWRAREIAKDIAKRKVEKMKEIAKVKAKEERKRLESEFELVLIVEKMQELRSIRIQKLKKQGHFLPEEDDRFLERVRAAVEEEERQAMAAAATDAAKDAIATAEESRKIIQKSGPDLENLSTNKGGDEENQDRVIESKNEEESLKLISSGPVNESLTSLPLEFYHYYHGSNTDMGTLIEVRRMWDAFIRPGGSRIPGHWVQPPPPADEIWASHLVKPK